MAVRRISVAAARPALLLALDRNHLPARLLLEAVATAVAGKPRGAQDAGTWLSTGAANGFTPASSPTVSTQVLRKPVAAISLAQRGTPREERGKDGHLVVSHAAEHRPKPSALNGRTPAGFVPSLASACVWYCGANCVRISAAGRPLSRTRRHGEGPT